MKIVEYCSDHDLFDSSCTTRAILYVSICCVIFIACQFRYLMFAFREKKSRINWRLNILNLRITLVLPVYSFVAFVISIFPIAAPIVDSVGAVFEGISFYSYFKFLELNASSTESSSDSMKISINKALLQFIIFRPLMLLLAGIYEIVSHSEGPVYRAFNILSMMSTALAASRLIRTHTKYAIYSSSYNVERSIICVKIFIVAIIIQNFITNITHHKR